MTLDWISPADRLQKLPPYVFARLDELKARAREQGLDLIDLGMGNPDGATPQPVVEAASQPSKILQITAIHPLKELPVSAVPLLNGTAAATTLNSIQKAKHCLCWVLKKV